MSDTSWADLITANVPGAKITSTLRTPGQNAAVGGVPDSAHLSGNAVDFTLPNQGAMQQVLSQIAKFAPGAKAIYEGPGAAHSTAPHVHVDFSGVAGGSPASGAPSAPGMSEDEKKLFQSAMEKQQKGEALTAEEIEANNKFGKQYADQVDQYVKGLPDAPKAPKLPEEELPEIRAPATAMTQFLPLLAVFGGALTKGAAYGAMNAAVGVMEGQQSGDTAARDRARQEWEDHMKTISDQYQLQRDEFGDVMKADQEKFKEKLSTFTMQHDLSTANAALQRGDTKNAIDIIRAALNAQGKMDSIYTRMVANPKLYQDDAGHILRMDPVTGGFLDSATGQAVQPQGGLHTIGGFARSPATQAFTDWKQDFVKQNGHEPTPADEQKFTARYQQINRQASEMVSGKEAQAVRAFNTAISHLDVLKELFAAQQSGSVQRINAAKLAVEKEFGAAAPANFQAARAVVANEIIKAITSSGGALTDRQDAQAELNKASSPEQMSGVIDTYQTLMAGQLQSIQQAYTANGGEEIRPFESYLEPRSLEVLNDVMGEHPAPAPSGGNPKGANKPSDAPSDAKQAPDGHWYSKNTGPDAKTHPWLRWD